MIRFEKLQIEVIGYKLKTNQNLMNEKILRI